MPAKKEVENTEEAPKASQVYTNYKAFVNAKLVPTAARCESNWQYFNSNGGRWQGCHTKIDLKTDNAGEDIIKHLEAGHSGGFNITMRPVREGAWKGWKTLMDAGIEIANLNCGVCQQDVLLHPQHLAKHMRPHLNWRKRQEKGGKFNIAFTRDTPLPEDDLGLLPKADYDFADDGWDE